MDGLRVVTGTRKVGFSARICDLRVVFWAPDSQSTAFPTLDRKLMTMRVPKGAQEFICGLNGAIRGGSWGEAHQAWEGRRHLQGPEQAATASSRSETGKPH